MYKRQQAKVDGRVYMLPMNYKEITSYVYLVRGDLMDKYDIKSVASLDEAEAYMDAIVANEPTLIPLDVGSDYDKLFVFDRMWQKANWESEEKVTGVGSWQAMASVSELDDGAAVKGNFDQPEFQGVIERLKDWKDRGLDVYKRQPQHGTAHGKRQIHAAVHGRPRREGAGVEPHFFACGLQGRIFLPPFFIGVLLGYPDVDAAAQVRCFHRVENGHAGQEFAAYGGEYTVSFVVVRLRLVGQRLRYAALPAVGTDDPVSYTHLR